MDHSDGKPVARDNERAQHPDGLRVAQAAADQAVRPWKRAEVIMVDASWWPTRSRQGVHVLNPSDAKLEHAKYVSWLAGTLTVYAYKTTLV